MKKLTTEEFIKEAKLVHGDKFDYSLVDYKGGREHVSIICSVHGEFIQRASAHIGKQKQGCKKCAGEDRRLGLDEFLKRAIQIHGDKYDYSLVTENKPEGEKIQIICKKHGPFNVSINHHINRGQGCPKCKSLNLDGFIEKANQVHDNKYDYSESVYINNKAKIDIICPTHGKFKQRVSDHINGKHGCPECTMETIRMTTDEFIHKAKLVHGDKFNYDRVRINFKSNKDYIPITCPIHGDFNQRVNTHLTGNGCDKCRYKSLADFINDSNIKHNDKYDYSLVKFNTTYDKIDIICPKHGIFNQRTSAHLDGQGCPKCKESKGEKEIRKHLINKKIKFISQYKFSNCKYKKELPFDFYLPNYNTCIEFNGEQHYRPIKLWGGDISFKKQQIKDNIKMEYCRCNNIPLIIIKYNENVLDVLNKYLTS